MIIRFNQERGREEYWEGDQWTVDPDHARLFIDEIEANRIANQIGGRVEDEVAVVGDYYDDAR